MACFGGTAVEVLFSPNSTYFQMPTAIIATRLTSGFFLAADGISRRESGELVSDREQKIFRIQNDQAHFAFAVTGTARFTPDDDANDIVFNFNRAVQNAGRELVLSPSADVVDYCDRVINLVNETLKREVEDAQKAGKAVRYPSIPDQYEGSTIASLFLCGYYSGGGYGIVSRFFHREQCLASPMGLGLIELERLVISGSKEVEDCLSSNDPRFAVFQAPRTKTPNFRELAVRAKSYVAACASDVGRATDPVHCPGIGGYVHAASVTPGRGFQWIKGFEYHRGT